MGFQPATTSLWTLAAKIEGLAKRIFPESTASQRIDGKFARRGSLQNEPSDKVGLIIPLGSPPDHHLEFIIGDTETQAFLTVEPGEPLIEDRLQNKMAFDFQGWLFKARTHWLKVTGLPVQALPPDPDDELMTLMSDLQKELEA